MPQQRRKIQGCARRVVDEAEHPGSKNAKQRIIFAFAPIACASHFTDFDLAEKWFKLNCRIIFEGEFTPAEKGDLIVWLPTFERSDRDSTPGVAKE